MKMKPLSSVMPCNIIPNLLDSSSTTAIMYLESVPCWLPHVGLRVRDNTFSLANILTLLLHSLLQSQPPFLFSAHLGLLGLQQTPSSSPQVSTHCSGGSVGALVGEDEGVWVGVKEGVWVGVDEGVWVGADVGDCKGLGVMYSPGQVRVFLILLRAHPAGKLCRWDNQFQRQCPTYRTHP